MYATLGDCSSFCGGDRTPKSFNETDLRDLYAWLYVA